MIEILYVDGEPVTATMGLPAGMGRRDYVDLAREAYQMILAAHPKAIEQKKSEKAHAHLVARSIDKLVQGAAQRLDGILEGETDYE